jgi:hypothetical protein
MAHGRGDGGELHLGSLPRLVPELSSRVAHAAISLRRRPVGHMQAADARFRPTRCDRLKPHLHQSVIRLIFCLSPFTIRLFRYIIFQGQLLLPSSPDRLENSHIVTIRFLPFPA